MLRSHSVVYAQASESQLFGQDVEPFLVRFWRAKDESASVEIDEQGTWIVVFWLIEYSTNRASVPGGNPNVLLLYSGPIWELDEPGLD